MESTRMEGIRKEERKEAMADNMRFDIDGYGRFSDPILLICPNGDVFPFEEKEIPGVLYILGRRRYMDSRLETVSDYRCIRPASIRLYHLCLDEESGDIWCDTWTELVQDVAFYTEYEVKRESLREAIRRILPDEVERLDRNEEILSGSLS